jgi:hypothetical protein
MTLLQRRIGSFTASAAVHLAIAIVLVVATRVAPGMARPEARQGSSRPQTLTIFVAPPEPSGLPGLRPDDADDDAAPGSLTARQAQVSIPGLTLNFQKVAARVKLLFPFITPGLALEQFLPAGSRHRPDTLPNPLLQSADPSRQMPPLLINRMAGQAMVDQAWSRHERWSAFQHLAPLLSKYDANEGDLPALLQMYFEQNGLQPFVENGAPDAKLWAQLAVAADHVDFIGAISSYASARPASKSTTSLLFVLDSIVQSNLEVLLTLLSLDPAADLSATRRASRTAYDFLVDLKQRYQRELARRRLESVESVRVFYDAVRLAILDTIVRTTPEGYRAGDARFLMGAIYWRQKNGDAALEQWRNIRPDAADTYALFYTAIHHALASSSAPVAIQVAIDRALNAERSQWRSLSYDRLNKFGYRFDTF